MGHRTRYQPGGLARDLLHSLPLPALRAYRPLLPPAKGPGLNGVPRGSTTRELRTHPDHLTGHVIIGDRELFQAGCCCGWQGRRWNNVQLALAEGIGHEDDMAQADPDRSEVRR
jgi:hypothetical protein